MSASVSPAASHAVGVDDQRQVGEVLRQAVQLAVDRVRLDQRRVEVVDVLDLVAVGYSESWNVGACSGLV